MKRKPTPTDPAFDVNLNPVRLPDGRTVSWGEAFPQVGTYPHLFIHRTFDESETR